MTTPEVSLVIPTHNRRAMVREAVMSAVAQRGARFEVIVVDDGSTDGSVDELAAIGRELSATPRAPAMRIERWEAARGPAAARNRGAEIARAPLIAFLDSDDLWKADKLARHLDYARRHPEYALSQTQEIWLRDGRRRNPGRRHAKRAGDIFIDSLRTCLVSPSAAMIDAELFRATGGFDEDMAAAEDYDLWLRVLIDHEAGLLDEPLVVRRAGHDGQLSATVAAIDRYRILALAKLLAHRRVTGARRDAVVEVIVEKAGIVARGAARRGASDDAELYESIAAQASSKWQSGADQSLFDTIAAVRRRIARVFDRDAARAAGERPQLA